MNWIDQIVRPNILRMKAYSSARSITEKNFDKVYLDANESPWPGIKNVSTVNRYPDPQPSKLRQKLADIYDVKPENVFMGRGADEAIDTLIRTYCVPGKDKILVTPPTYGFYKVCADISDVEVVESALVAERDFALNIEALKTRIDENLPNLKIIFLCNPNNPTGNGLEIKDILEILDYTEGKALVVVDEAYIEFSKHQSLSQYLPKYSNLVILRTLSKAWGLAGIRFGVALASEEILGYMFKVLAPYPLGVNTIETLNRMLEDEGYQSCCARVAEIIELRDWFVDELKSFDFIEKVLPTETNYVTFCSKKKQEILNVCNDSNIVVRDRSKDLFLENCIRVSIGTKAELSRLLTAFGSLKH